MDFSDRLQKYIKENGITQQELAPKIGVSRSTLNIWIKSGTKPAISWHKRLEEFFGLSAKELGIERYCERCGGVLTKEGTRYCDKCGNTRGRRERASKTEKKKLYPPDKRCARCKFWSKDSCIQILVAGHKMRKTDETGNCMQYEKRDGQELEFKDRLSPVHITKIEKSPVICSYDFDKIAGR